MSRFRTFAIFAVMVALAATLAACGSSGNSDEDPKQVVENASLEGVESGKIDLSLDVKSTGKEAGDVKVNLSGQFQGKEGKNSLPELALAATAKGKAEGEDIDFKGGITVLSNRAYVDYDGTVYEVDPTTFGVVKSAFEDAQRGSGDESGSADVGACQDAAAGMKFGDFAENLKNEGSADVDGTSTTKISGNLNVGGAIDALIKLSEDPACSAQLEAAGQLPIEELEEARGEITGAVKTAHAEIYVGDDDIVRKLVAELVIEPQGSGEEVEINLDLTLSDVNEEQEITAVDNAMPLEGLFRKLELNPLELFEILQGEEGFEGLLDQVTEGVIPSVAEDAGSGSGGNSGASQQEYLNCLKGANSPSDLQKCANLAG